MTTALEVLFWLAVALIVWAQLGYPLALIVAARAAGPAPQPQPRVRRHAVSLIVAAHDEEAVIAAKVANARELDYPRGPAGGHRRLRRLQRPHGRRWRAKPAPTSCSSCRAAARSAPRTPPCECARGEIVAFSDANAQWEPDAARAARRRIRRSRRRLRLRPGALRGRRRARRRQPGGPLLALRDGRATAPSRACRSVTAGNGAIYATRRDSYIVVDPVMGHDLSLPFNMVKRGLRAMYVPAALATREDGPDKRGRVRAQAAHDEPHLADHRARRDALAARLSAALRADDRLAPAAALLPARAARARPRGEHRARRARRRRALRRTCSVRSSRCSSPPCSAAPCTRVRCSSRATTC